MAEAKESVLVVDNDPTAADLTTSEPKMQQGLAAAMVTDGATAKPTPKHRSSSKMEGGQHDNEHRSPSEH